ncbi:death domain-containing immune deficiency protein [Arctopsyche grandis]|uniref:death domain-containing immune deficiency protein n=1 Tax=Arctopsyche grandis TaxID=121162 RepID=UPI00406D6BDE
MEQVCPSQIQTDAVPVSPRPSPPKGPTPQNASSTSSTSSASPLLSTINGASVCSPGTSINISNCNYIQFGNSLVYNTTQTVIQGQSQKGQHCKTNGFSKSKSPEKSLSIQLLMDSKQEVSIKYMTLISKNLGEGWRNIFRSMGYKDGFIETIVESHKQEGISEVIYQMLLDWIRNPEKDEEERTIGELSTILWDSEKYELVEQLANLSKDPTSEKMS